MSLQPGVAVGTMNPQDDEKVVYLTFDDGPSANTQRVLDILDQYDAKLPFHYCPAAGLFSYDQEGL